MNRPTVLLTGLGRLGSVLLEALARQRFVGRILVASRNAERGAARCNLALLGAVAEGFDPEIEFVSADLSNLDRTAEMVHRERPDIVVHTATMQSWLAPYEMLPPAMSRRFANAGIGIWLPVHLTLTMRLMEALRACHFAGLSITAPFPDAVNVVLQRIGLAPTSGLGNVDEMVPKVRVLAARKLGVPTDSFRILLVAHHSLWQFVFRGRQPEMPPFFLRVEHDGCEIPAEEFLFAPLRVTGGAEGHFLTTSSTIALLRAVSNDGPSLLHAPAPGGLPGGYPVLASRKGINPAPIPGLSIEEAIRLNTESHRFDGIERIEDDGTTVFRDESVEFLKRELNFDCPRLKPSETAERATELITRFREYAQRHSGNF